MHDARLAMRLPVNWARRLRFAALEKVALPIGILPLRALVRTWRTRGAGDPNFLALMAAPRAVVATYHGMFLHLLAYARITPRYRRRLVVLVSPSLDGRLLAATLAHFGIGHVLGTSQARGVSGAREFIARIAAGDIGVIAADGPRGPCCVAKPGLLEIAALADAQVFLAIDLGAPRLDPAFVGSEPSASPFRRARYPGQAVHTRGSGQSGPPTGGDAVRSARPGALDLKPDPTPFAAPLTYEMKGTDNYWRRGFSRPRADRLESLSPEFTHSRAVHGQVRHSEQGTRGNARHDRQETARPLRYRGRCSKSFRVPKPAVS